MTIYHNAADGLRRCRAHIRACPRGGHKSVRDWVLYAADTQQPLAIRRNDYTVALIPKGGTVKLIGSLGGKPKTKRVGTKEARARAAARRKAARLRAAQARTALQDFEQHFRKGAGSTSTYRSGEMSAHEEAERDRLHDQYRYARGDYALTREDAKRMRAWEEQQWAEAEALAETEPQGDATATRVTPTADDEEALAEFISSTWDEEDAGEPVELPADWDVDLSAYDLFDEEDDLYRDDDLVKEPAPLLSHTPTTYFAFTQETF